MRAPPLVAVATIPRSLHPLDYAMGSRWLYTCGSTMRMEMVSTLCSDTAKIKSTKDNKISRDVNIELSYCYELVRLQLEDELLVEEECSVRGGELAKWLDWRPIEGNPRHIISRC